MKKERISAVEYVARCIAKRRAAQARALADYERIVARLRSRHGPQGGSATTADGPARRV